MTNRLGWFIAGIVFCLSLVIISDLLAHERGQRALLATPTPRQSMTIRIRSQDGSSVQEYECAWDEEAVYNWRCEMAEDVASDEAIDP